MVYRVLLVHRGAQVCQDQQVPQELWVHRGLRDCQGRWVKQANLVFLEEMGCLAKKEYMDYQESRALQDLQARLA